jgi:hypothetical protein
MRLSSTFSLGPLRLTVTNTLAHYIVASLIAMKSLNLVQLHLQAIFANNITSV